MAGLLGSRRLRIYRVFLRVFDVSFFAAPPVQLLSVLPWLCAADGACCLASWHLRGWLVACVVQA